MGNDQRPVVYRIDDQVAWIYLNRPSRLNAVNPELVEALCQTLMRAERDQARAVILMGKGKSFCSGHDLREEESPVKEAELYRRVQNIQDVTRIIRRLPMPVIAAVHGYALGAGCEFALCCDIIIAEDQAVFGFPEVSVGLSVTGGISYILPKTIGEAKAKELLFFGERFGAAEAEKLGLINRVAETGKLHEAATDMANRLAAMPQMALSRAKFSINNGSQSIDMAYHIEVDYALYTGQSQEAMEEGKKFKDNRNKGGL
ncbi:enoyl-CoA hydratase/carnithine racemase [Scopulibacillus darangshiensis]|uniref:Enoyl-CoA hydratase/carnithine racemase n=1 Tax=Scopulibacillus darangshiensis TaxID=442528 RepID=A0A4R2NHL8_9BACL|nr:enoyl-CoA hydratase/isomerase family protein [Scopulibacillus darangshiensis]TCP20655.1 enoyl-CoA hydratase/carnithine racemase [Scopulibacillus darangshiensis]